MGKFGHISNLKKQKEVKMNEKIQILEAKLWGAIDATLCKGYSLKKAKQFINV